MLSPVEHPVERPVHYKKRMGMGENATTSMFRCRQSKRLIYQGNRLGCVGCAYWFSYSPDPNRAPRGVGVRAGQEERYPSRWNAILGRGIIRARDAKPISARIDLGGPERVQVRATLGGNPTRSCGWPQNPIYRKVGQHCCHISYASAVPSQISGRGVQVRRALYGNAGVPSLLAIPNGSVGSCVTLGEIYTHGHNCLDNSHTNITN